MCHVVTLSRAMFSCCQTSIPGNYCYFLIAKGKKQFSCQHFPFRQSHCDSGSGYLLPFLLVTTSLLSHVVSPVDGPLLPFSIVEEIQFPLAVSWYVSLFSSRPLSLNMAEILVLKSLLQSIDLNYFLFCHRHYYKYLAYNFFNFLLTARVGQFALLAIRLCLRSKV